MLRTLTLYSIYYFTLVCQGVVNFFCVDCHMYADDTQIYLRFSVEQASSALYNIESCIFMGDNKRTLC